jgi:hypothetical protein
MKRKMAKPEGPRRAAPQGLKEQEHLDSRSRQLLKEGNRKRALLSPSQPHSKTFGH